jgi:putative flippase GtrA
LVVLACLVAAGLGPVAADAASVALAACASYVLHRRLTVARDPHLRWLQVTTSYVVIAILTGLVDVLVLWAVLVGVSDVSDPSASALVAAKAVSLGAAASVRVAAYRGILFSLISSTQLEPSRRPPPAGAVRFTVVIPAFRAEGEIGRTVAQVGRELADVAASGGLQIVVVDDGSPDRTAAEAEAAGADLVLRQPENRGKGAAVRAGMAAASGRTVAFTDADLSYSPDQLRLALTTVEEGWDVVVGSRHHVDTVTLVRSRRLREVTGRAFNRLTALVLLGRYRDTQCGLKAFRGDVARLLFGKSIIDGFAFDVEILHLVERYELALTEIPVTLASAETSTVRVGSHARAMVRDLFRIRREAARGRYDVGGPLPLPAPAERA